MVLQRMRAGAQGVMAKVLVAVIVFVLAVFGFGAIDLFSASEPVAATVNGEDITQRVLEQETTRQREFQRSQFGEQAPQELIDQMVTPPVVLQALIDRALLSQAAADLDLAVAAETLDARVAWESAGADPATYRRWLASMGYTPDTRRLELAAAETREQLIAGLRDTAIVTARQLRDASRLQYQRRDIAWLLFDVPALAAEATVADADIEAHYGNHIDDYMAPETFDFAVARLPYATLEAAVEVDEEAVATAYADEVAALEPLRHGAHILLKIGEERTLAEATEQLAAVREEILAGADFAEQARELSEDAGSASAGGDLGPAGKGVFATAFEDALWALAPGDLSLPVETEFGVHLIKLIAIEEPEVPTLETRRPAILAQLREDALRGRVDEAQRDLDEIAFEQGDSLTGLEEAYGTVAETLAGVTRTSRDGLLADAAVREALFSDEVLLEGFNSRAVVTGDQDVVVGRLQSRAPATERPLDEVRDDIRNTLAQADAQDQAEAAALAALTALAAGDTPAAVAEQTGVAWERADGLTTDATDVDAAIIEVAFKMPAPAPEQRETDVATLANGSRAVVVLSNVVLGDYGAVAEADRTTLEEALQRLDGERDFRAMLATLRADASISALAFDEPTP